MIKHAWLIVTVAILIFMTIGMIHEKSSIGSILGMWMFFGTIIAVLLGLIFDDEEDMKKKETK